MLDPSEFGKAMASIVNDAIAPLRKEIEELKARQPQRGEDGKDADPAEIQRMVADAIAALPKPRDGKDADPEHVKALVAEAIAQIPVPQDGKDAEPVAVSDVVKELLAADGLKTMVDLQVAEAVETLPKPADGRDGKDGEPGPKGDPGTKGDPGRDGLDVKDLFRADGGHLLAVMSDGTTKDLGTYVGKDGENGKDGRDGLGFDDCDVEVAEGMVTLKFIRGDMVKSVRYPVPTFDHIGFWAEGKSAKAGDHTTHDGNLWRAIRDTTQTPSYQSSDWQLAARKGADGQRGKDGKDYRPAGPVKLKGSDDA